MLRVPCLRQPTKVTCLPTCVRAVLAYHGREIGDGEAAEMCNLGHAGAVAELAVDGLTDAGIDFSIRQFAEIGELGEELDDSGPVIAFVGHPSGSPHAVVVCDVDEDAVTFMDPAFGEYTTLSTAEFESAWQQVEHEAMTIGRATG